MAQLYTTHKQNMIMIYLLLLIWAAVCNGQDTIVNTKYGEVEGHVVDISDEQSILSFLAIPFAKPPVGQRRFAPPEEPDPWDERFVADTPGNACTQGGGTLDITHPDYDRIDEDCLNLNIFTPYNHAEPGPYPVHVFIHGGSYSGSANIQYPGHFYAARGVIMVAINYRLGRIGFLSSGDQVAPGNWGILDQKLGLEFVRENIRNFNGDPDRVTLSGHSAGGASVGIHQLSPASQGLFHQIIFMSGSDLSVWSANSVEAASNISRQIALEVNCTVDNTQTMIDCLREASVDDIMDADYDRYPGDVSLGFVPTVGVTDGILPDTPTNLRDSGQFAMIPAMVGKTDREVGTIFILDEDGFNSTEFREFVEDAASVSLGGLGQHIVDDVSNAVIFQFSPWPHIEDRIANRERLMDAAEDLAFGIQTDQTAKVHYRRNLPTYEYKFGYFPPVLEEVLPRFVGIFHMLDMGWVFGHVLIQESPDVGEDLEIEGFGPGEFNFTETDLQYARYWHDLFSNFIKHGNPTPTPWPSPGNHPPTIWKAATVNEPNYLNVRNESIRLIVGRRQRDNAIWTDYIPWLISKNSSDATDASLNLQMFDVSMWQDILDGSFLSWLFQ